MNLLDKIFEWVMIIFCGFTILFMVFASIYISIATKSIEWEGLIITLIFVILFWLVIILIKKKRKMLKGIEK